MDSSRERRKNEPSTETESGDLLEAVKSAIGHIQKRLSKDGGEKGSVTDLVRLLQLRKELEEDSPRNISARWIDECRTSTD